MKLKNQNKFHATVDGKKTLCGLSNQWGLAISIDELNKKACDSSWVKYCCEKCQKAQNK